MAYFPPQEDETFAWLLLPNHLRKLAVSKLNIHLFYDPVVLLLGLYPGEMKLCVRKKTSTRMFMAAVFLIAPNWKHSCPARGKGTHKLLYMSTREHRISQISWTSSPDAIRRKKKFQFFWMITRSPLYPWPPPLISSGAAFSLSQPALWDCPLSLSPLVL